MRRDGTGKCPVKWYIDELGKKRWVCFAHLAPYYRHQESSETCWYSTCPGRSMVGYPYTEAELQEQKGAEARKKILEAEKSCAPKSCDNYGCSKKVASGRKRYCSDTCRKAKARADYESRNPNRRRKGSKDRRETPTEPTQPAPPVSPPKSKVRLKKTPPRS